MPLSEEQISIFLNDGVLVVDNVLTDSQLQDSLIGLSETLAQHGVDTNALEGTGCNLALLSSTGGSGGVLDIAYYDEWKINNIASNPNLFAITKQLWHAAYNCIHGKNNGEILEKMDDNWRVHPYGNFDCEKGYMYIDRVGYRLPSDLAEKLGELNAARNHCMQNCPQNASKINATPAKHGKSKKRKSRSIQRSLTPHLDCCPDDFSSLQGKTKWRPIQCFVSLVDTVFPNHGGFEAAKGFHIDFARWSCNRPPAIIAEKNIGKNNQQPNDLKLIPAPCVGEYTHIRPKEDADVMSRIRHIPVKAGAAVFWDNRIPHANAYRHEGNVPRAVVYCSFLPDVTLNRKYAQEQLEKWAMGKPPSDQWINLKDHPVYGGSDSICPANNGDTVNETIGEENKRKQMQEIRSMLTPLGCRMAGLDSWDS